MAKCLVRFTSFSSMVVDAEKNGAQWADKNDKELLELADSPRKTRLDEFPSW